MKSSEIQCFGRCFIGANFKIALFLLATLGETVCGSTIYRQPKGAVNLSTNVFVNPRPWPRPDLINKTCSVFWQRSHLNRSIVTPYFATDQLSRLTGVKVKPAEQATCGEVGEELHSTPWSAVQYSSTGIYGAAINTTNAKEIYRFLVAGAGFEPTTFGL